MRFFEQEQPMDNEPKQRKVSQKWANALLILCLIVAAFAFIPGYDYRYPHYHADEVWFLQELFAMNDFAGYEITLPSYPPGILVLYQVTYKVLDFFEPSNLLETNPYSVVQSIRLVSAIVNVMTTALIFLTARRLANLLVAVVAALAWALMPYVTFSTLVALTEPWVVFCFTLTFYGLVRGLQERNGFWLVISVVAGLVAIIWKYNVFPVLGFGVGATVIQLFWQWRNQDERGIWLRTLGIQFALILGVALWLFLVYDAGVNLNKGESAQFRTTGFMLLFNLNESLDVLGVASTRLGIILPVFAGVVLVGGFFYLHSAQAWQRIAYVVAVGGWYVNQHIIVTYNIFTFGKIKYSIPSSGIGAVLFALALYSLCLLAAQTLKNKRLTPLFYLPLVALWILPNAYDQYQMTLHRVLLNTFSDFQDWTALTISDSGTIFMNHLAYERMFGESPDNDLPWLFDGVRNGRIVEYQFRILDLYGGYQGPPIPWIVPNPQDGEFIERTAEEWRSIYVNYVMLDREGVRTLSLPESQISLDDLLLLRNFPPEGTAPDAFTGTRFSVYRIGRMNYEVDMVLGDTVHLVGFELNDDESLSAGDALEFTPYWRAEDVPKQNYQVYLHLVPLESREVLAQADGMPSRSQRPMTSWILPDETIIGTNFTIMLPEDLAAGDYRLLLGLYDLQTGQRLLAENGEDYLLVKTIRID